jgi:hypothetical protein
MLVFQVIEDTNMQSFAQIKDAPLPFAGRPPQWIPSPLDQ